jgi:NhaP-type Na+/H+ or K+/H+ antiporter
MQALKRTLENKITFLVLCVVMFMLYVGDTLLAPYISGTGETIFVVFIAGLLLLSALTTALAEGTIFPSFIVALFVGLSLHDVLAPLVQNTVLLNTIVSVSAIYILFGGGLEIVYDQFKKIVLPTLILSFIGLGISIFLFPWLMSLLPVFETYGITIATTLLLGAVLASTDPAAIIPVMKQLSFKKHQIKDIIISESALTDVTGTLVTFSFLYYVSSQQQFQTLRDGFFALFNYTSVTFLVEEIVFGIIAGLIGFVGLHFFLKHKEVKQEGCADVALFIAVPLVVFSLASLFHGSGYLAAFISGLLILMNEKCTRTESFFSNMTDGIAKPLIFIFLGAMVDVQSLVQYAIPGIIAGLIFIVVVRPVSVFASLYFFKKNVGLTTKELWFISSVRETGVIPAVLLLQVSSAPGINAGPAFLAIGMWVILLTLVLLPPITPWIAKKLDIAHR